MSNEAGVFQETKDDCGYCCNGRINIIRYSGDLKKNFRLYIYPEIIQPILEEEEIISSVEDFRDLLIDIEIGQNGSGEIKCPVCK